MCIDGEFIRNVKVGKRNPRIGYRSWGYYRGYSTGFLNSVSWNETQTWRNKIAESSVVKYDYSFSPPLDTHEHTVPDYFNHHSIGLHICKSWKTLPVHFSSLSVFRDEKWAGEEYVTGIVRFWGNCVEFTTGWLAEYATIVKVNLPSTYWLSREDAAMLRANYPWVKFERRR